MNERIALLKSQCIVREQRGTTAFNSYMVDRFDTEKFAELIVRECADICNKIYFDRYPDAEEWERSEEGDAIKKHFGIE